MNIKQVSKRTDRPTDQSNISQ